MRKLMLVLVVGLLTSGCVFGFHHRRHHSAQVHVAHVHGHACGHVLVNGAWIVVRR